MVGSISRALRLQRWTRALPSAAGPHCVSAPGTGSMGQTTKVRSCSMEKKRFVRSWSHTFTFSLLSSIFRYQYRLVNEGQPSSMTAERMNALNSIGFVWDTQAALWAQRYAELKEFLLTHGHTNVPGTYELNLPLATWVKCQRRYVNKHLVCERNDSVLSCLTLLVDLVDNQTIQAVQKGRGI